MRTARPLLAAASLLAAFAAALPVPASAYPSGAWRTRSTGAGSDGQCTRRAFRAMKVADLSPQASGDTGVYGHNDAVIVYVICLNQGSFATIFRSSDRRDSGGYTARVCDTVSRQMER